MTLQSFADEIVPLSIVTSRRKYLVLSVRCRSQKSCYSSSPEFFRICFEELITSASVTPAPKDPSGLNIRILCREKYGLNYRYDPGHFCQGWKSNPCDFLR